jgi:starch phosphorylase
MAWFSSDRTIREYAEEIWNVPVNPTAPAFQEAEDRRDAAS